MAKFLYKPCVAGVQIAHCMTSSGLVTVCFSKHKFTASNCEALLQNSLVCVSTVLSAIWTIIIRTLHVSFQPAVLWNVSTVFKVSRSLMETYQGLTGEMLASLYGLLCRGVKCLQFASEMSFKVLETCRWLSLSDYFDIAEAESFCKVLVKLYKSLWVQWVLQLIMSPKFWHT